MQNSQDAEMVGEFSAPLPAGTPYFSRHLDIVRAGGRVLETEIELLSLKQAGSVPTFAKHNPIHDTLPNHPSPKAETSTSQLHTSQYHFLGRAIISTTISTHWEANLELLQAKTPDRFQNMQIFAALLSCVRRICAQRYIAHLAVVDIVHPKQKWYRHFFRLTGFRRCRCPASDPAQPETRRRCLTLRNAPPEECPNACERHRNGLAESRGTRGLSESVALGEADEVERGCFHHLLEGCKEEKSAQSAQAATACEGGDERPRRESVKRRALRAAQRSKARENANRVSKSRGVSDVPKRHRPSNRGRTSDEIFRA